MKQENPSIFLPYFITEPVFIIRKNDVHTKTNGQNSGLEEGKKPYLEKERDHQINNSNSIEEPNPDLEKAAKADQPPPIVSIPYAGKNLKKILILFENKESKHLPKEEEIFLEKIIQAVKLNFDDIAIVNIAFIDKSSYNQINNFDALIQISFGVKNDALVFNSNLPLYNTITDSGKTFLLTDMLSEIQSDKEKKVLLWNNLQKLFNKP